MKTKIAVCAVIAVMFFVGISFAGGVPKCSDPKVVTGVCSIVRNEMRNEFFGAVRTRIVNNKLPSDDDPTDEPTDADIFLRLGNPTARMMTAIIVGADTPERLRKVCKDKPMAIALLDAMDMRTSDLTFSISGTRMEWRDDGIKKCLCSGEITLDGLNKTTRTASYSAQYTDDGRVYVQLLGVR